MKDFIRNLIAGFFLSIFIISCSNDDSPVTPAESPEKNLTIFYTNDEHGWMEKTTNHSGAPSMYAEWKNDGLGSEDKFLVLSGGDMWTGPAISTWFKGESMQQVMNGMEYDAAAIGNHEFDFTVSVLKERISQSTFPYLSANIREKSTGEIPEFATPYIIKKINGIDIGIIGLTTTSTPITGFSKNVENYNFIDYDTALRNIADEVKTDGAELTIVLGHISPFEMQALAPTLTELGIDIILGGHSHEQFKGEIGEILMLEAGSNLQAFGKIDLVFDDENDKIKTSSLNIIQNQSGSTSDKITNIINNWKQQLNNSLSEVIGYSSGVISRQSIEMYNLVCNSWLFKFEEADISITNAGGIRQSIPQGDIKFETIVGLLPFENNIFKLKMTGSEVIQCLPNHIYGGIKKTNGGYEFTDGSSFDLNTTYTVLTTDYLYYRNDTNFSKFDETPTETYLNYRGPVIDWLKSINSTSSDPIQNYLDYSSK